MVEHVNIPFFVDLGAKLHKIIEDGVSRASSLEFDDSGHVYLRFKPLDDNSLYRRIYVNYHHTGAVVGVDVDLRGDFSQEQLVDVLSLYTASGFELKCRFSSTERFAGAFGYDIVGKLPPHVIGSMLSDLVEGELSSENLEIPMHISHFSSEGERHGVLYDGVKQRLLLRRYGVVNGAVECLPSRFIDGMAIFVHHFVDADLSASRWELTYSCQEKQGPSPTLSSLRL